MEQVLFNVANGKRGALTPEECRQLGLKLGVPGEWLAKRKADGVPSREKAQAYMESITTAHSTVADKFVIRAAHLQGQKDALGIVDVDVDEPEWGDWIRDDSETFELLSLVDAEVPLETINGWPDEQCQAADDWAAATHLRASDNEITVPPMPEYVRVARMVQS